MIAIVLVLAAVGVTRADDDSERRAEAAAARAEAAATRSEEAATRTEAAVQRFERAVTALEERERTRGRKATPGRRP